MTAILGGGGYEEGKVHEYFYGIPKALGVRKESILIIQLPTRRSMSRSRILVSKVMTKMCLLLLIPSRMRALRENATIATSLGIRRHIAGS